MKGKKIFMVGAGGIGMSALAQFLKAGGAEVSGSDREESPTIALLRSKGIPVTIGHRRENVPADADLVVYSEAVPVDNAERVRARELAISEQSYFEALGDAARGKRTVAVSGTHGKTTTTAMAGKILADAGADPTAIVGSIVPAWGSNFRSGGSDIFIVEACEYKRHFLVFNPDVLVITNTEWDHTDFYKTPAEYEAAFDEARGQAKTVIDKAKYGTEVVPELKVPGEFNKENARAAKAAVKALGLNIAEEVIDASLASYAGTWRRFEYKGKTSNGAEVYDDYAHHPTAVRETLRALRATTNNKIIVAFHPHLYSRTRDLLDEFAVAFVDAGEVLVAPIYAAREKDDGTISSDVLAERIRTSGVAARALSFDAIERELRALGSENTIITMGAGDIYKIADKLVA